MSNDVDHRCRGLAASQHGILDRAQVSAFGMSRYAISRRVAAGEWEMVLPAVYRLSGAPVTWFQKLMAAVLWAGPGAAVSHRAAAALYGLPGFPRDTVEVSTTKPRHSARSWVLCHRVEEMPGGHLNRWSGIPVTSPDRTLLDLAGTSGLDRAVLERCLDEVLRRGLASRFRIDWTVRNARCRGRRVLRDLLDVRLPGYVPPHGELEAEWLRLVKRSGLPMAEREEELEADGYHGRVDFVWPQFLVAVETDGFRWHTSHHSWQRDLTKRNLLARRGYRFLHVTWEDVMERPREVIESLSDLLRYPQQK